MPTEAEGQAAIDGLDGKALKDRTLKVSAARPRSDNRDRGSYDDRERGGGGRQRRY